MSSKKAVFPGWITALVSALTMLVFVQFGFDLFVNSYDWVGRSTEDFFIGVSAYALFGALVTYSVCYFVILAIQDYALQYYWEHTPKEKKEKKKPIGFKE